jgi:shikimate dehydrogenase
MDGSGKTKITGIFGYPVEHTLSPLMHNTAYNVLKLNICYLAFRVSPQNLSDAVKAVRALNILGVNITVPHKENVIPLLDGLDKEAKFIGAVNTVVNHEGRLIGYNTDGKGFMKSLSEARISVNNKNVLILGAGGAARAISYYLSEKVSKLFLYDIDREKAKKLIRDLKKIRGNIFAFNLRSSTSNPAFNEIDIIINATPLGWKKDDPLPVNTKNLTSRQVVCDLIYKKTPLLDKASKKGCKTLDGSGMLLWQGALAFELFTGVKPPVDIMRKALLSKI